MQTTTAAKTTRLAFRGLLAIKGYTICELAQEINVPADKLSSRIRGRVPWDWATVLAVCKAADIKLDEFARYYPG